MKLQSENSSPYQLVFEIFYSLLLGFSHVSVSLSKVSVTTEIRYWHDHLRCSQHWTVAMLL